MLASPVAPAAGQDGLQPDAGFRGLDIVLACDPASAHHKMLCLLLRKWGHRVTFDADGRAGESQVDLVLLDLDARGMAGWFHGAAVPGWRVGMVADREAWVQQHGALPALDELLGKPVSPQALRAAVESARAASPQQGAAAAAPGAGAFDYGRALAQADVWIVGVIVEDFIRSWPGQLDALRQAHVQGDAGTVQRTAHTLRGLAANFNAEPVCRIARTIEQAGPVAAQAGFAQWHAELAAELAALGAALAAFQQASAQD